MASRKIVCMFCSSSFHEKAFPAHLKREDSRFNTDEHRAIAKNWTLIKDSPNIHNAYEELCGKVKGLRSRTDVEAFKEAFVQISDKIKVIDNIDVPGMTWHRNQAQYLKSVAEYYNNSQHSRNYTSVCSRLFKAANSDDIKDCFNPTVITAAILNPDNAVKTKLEYISMVQKIRRLAYLKCLVQVRAEHLHWLKEVTHDLRSNVHKSRGIPSERKEEIEGFVEEITEKIKPLLTEEMLIEIEQLYEVDPEMYLKVMFARVYVKNPPRVTTYTKLKPPQLL